MWTQIQALRKNTQTILSFNVNLLTYCLVKLFPQGVYSITELQIMLRYSCSHEGLMSD